MEAHYSRLVRLNYEWTGAKVGEGTALRSSVPAGGQAVNGRHSKFCGRYFCLQSRVAALCERDAVPDLHRASLESWSYDRC